MLSAAAALVVLFQSCALACPMVFSAAAVGSAGGLAEGVGQDRCPGLGAAVYCGSLAGMTSK